MMHITHSSAPPPPPPAPSIPPDSMVVAAPCISFCHRSCSATSSARSRKINRGPTAGCRSGPAAVQTVTALVSDAGPVEMRRCECFDLHQELVPFAESWAWQKSVVSRRKELALRDVDHSDTLVTLQHPPVYTLDTDSREEYLHFHVKDAPIEIHRIDRGGKVTYHGPGLKFVVCDLKLSLEEVIIRALQDAFSIKASRINGLAGVWVGGQKVAAIGIHVSRWIAYHGLALNVTTDLTPFELIVPCGIKDRGVGSIKEMLQMTSCGIGLDDAVLINIAHKSLIKEFAEVFKLSMDISAD